MKIVQINATCGSGSTGKICSSISVLLNGLGIENYILYSSGNSDYEYGLRYMTDVEIKKEAFISRCLGNYGFEAQHATKRLISILNEINPDIIHIHNVHSHNCNLELLFDYIRKKDKKIIWTFHDCWAFTGSCTYFTFVGCNKWKTYCDNCPKAHEFSWFFDSSKKSFERKRQLLENVNMTIVTPSRWLASLVGESFLNNYPIEIINNGIDIQIFCPTTSSFRSDFSIDDTEKIVLGVGFEWEPRKGIDVFIALDRLLPPNYRIVIVGTNDNIDKFLPKRFISIHRTQNQKQLAEIYTAADVFVNPTREDNYPTVNMESLACGTPVVTFNVGGSAEMVDETCGIVVEKDDLLGLVDAIQKIAETGNYGSAACLKKAQAFNSDRCFMNYIELYKRII